MKWKLLFADVARGRLKHIIARVESILGNPSSAFPGVHITEELKDQTEASIGDLEIRKGAEPEDSRGEF